MISRIVTLTTRQADALTAIKKLIKEQGITPTQQEIATYMGISPNAVNIHIKNLIARGALTNMSNKSRAIAPVKNIRIRVVDRSWRGSEK